MSGHGKPNWLILGEHVEHLVRRSGLVWKGGVKLPAVHSGFGGHTWVLDRCAHQFIAFRRGGRLDSWDVPEGMQSRLRPDYQLVPTLRRRLSQVLV